MSATLQPPPSRAGAQDAEALFREARIAARRRRRRRAGVVGLVAIALALAGIGYLVLGPGGGRSGSSGGRPPVAVRVRSVTLPSSGRYSDLAVVDGRLVLSGGPAGSPLPSGYGASNGGCDSALVDPVTLGLGQGAARDCEDPALYGERVLPVVSAHAGASGPPMALAISRVDPGSRRGYSVGSVVLRYEECSNCDAQWVYGDGSLWIYGVAAPRGAVLLRVSERDGAVEQRLSMPQIDRPLLAADADGLWLAPSVLSGWPAATAPSRRYVYQSLYLIAPGSRAAKRVLGLASTDARWLTASGDTLWLQTADLKRPVLVRLHGTNVAARDAYHPPTPDALEYWVGPSNYAGSASRGVWYVLASGKGLTQWVVHIAAGQSVGRTVATVQPPFEVGYAETAGVLFHGSFYFLDPAPSPANGYPDAPRRGAILYRVTP